MSGFSVPIHIHDSCQMMKELDELNDEFELQLQFKEKQTVCGIEVPSKEQVDEMPDMPEILELSSSIKKYWTVLQEAIEKHS